jgi:hypothetical protein
MATLNFTSLDTIAGGDGTDNITMSDASTVVDASFTNVTSVETINLHSGNDTLVLGALSMAAGIVTVNPLAGTNTVTVGAGHTSALTIALTTGTDTVTGTDYTGVLTVTADIDNITSADTITGGTGTSDVLTITRDGTGDAAVNATDLGAVTAIETFLVNGTTVAGGVTIADANVADGKTLHIDGSSLTTGVLTANLAADTNGINTVTGGDAADAITLSSSDLGDTITGGAGNDNFTLDAAADLTSLDTIAGGDGTDTITMGAAGTVADAGFTNVTSVETLTGSSGNDTITLGPLATAAGIVTVTMAAVPTPLLFLLLTPVI